MDDKRSDLERRLRDDAIWIAKHSSGDRYAAIAGHLDEAAEALAECRAALEASRVWWDDTDPYHGEWKHGWPCDAGKPCAACAARDMIRRVLGEA